nr:ubiquitin hydrolase [Tanacetum cinerariifolium]
MKHLVTIKKEKEGLDSKLTSFEFAAKDLDTLLGSQRTDKNKEGLGYSAVPPLAQVYSPPKKDIDSSVSEHGESSESIMSKPMIKFVKAADCAEVKTNKVKAARKPSVKYAEMYRNTSKSPKVRGNQRNWNNLKTQQLGKDFVMKKKASFKCGHFDHLAYDCRVWVKQGKNRPNNNFAHKNVTPRADLFKTTSVSAARRVNTAAPRPNVNSA